MLVSAFLLFGVTTATLSSASIITQAGFGSGSTATSLEGIYALVKRRVPSHANSFNFELVNGNNDSFILADSQSKNSTPSIDIKCTSISACAHGLYT
jgi:alpha-N-acetylglucosaminidase